MTATDNYTGEEDYAIKRIAADQVASINMHEFETKDQVERKIARTKKQIIALSSSEMLKNKTRTELEDLRSFYYKTLRNSEAKRLALVAANNNQ